MGMNDLIPDVICTHEVWHFFVVLGRSRLVMCARHRDTSSHSNGWLRNHSRSEMYSWRMSSRPSSHLQPSDSVTSGRKIPAPPNSSHCPRHFTSTSTASAPKGQIGPAGRPLHGCLTQLGRVPGLQPGGRGFTSRFGPTRIRTLFKLFYGEAKGSCKTPIDSESLSQWAFSGPSQTLPMRPPPIGREPVVIG